jgi:hypothetical protein
MRQDQTRKISGHGKWKMTTARRSVWWSHGDGAKAGAQNGFPSSFANGVLELFPSLTGKPKPPAVLPLSEAAGEPGVTEL